MHSTENLRVLETIPLPTPTELKESLPISEQSAAFVAKSRAQVEAVIEGRDPRLLAIVGPCSIHDPKAALEYAERLTILRDQLSDQLLVCMRVYFEKPRTTVGWKGLINDPNLDGTQDVTEGLRVARQLLLDLTEMGMPAAVEALDPVMPQYLSDLVSWSAIGARTTESQTHREMASGLSMPIGFKNGTEGGLTVAINAMQAAQAPHSFLGIDGDGRVCVVRTGGNPHSHVVLRGGSTGPNYQARYVQLASKRLDEAGLTARVLIDCSHANSEKNHDNQARVAADVAEQLARGSRAILGVMVESNLVAGRQDLVIGGPLTYGQSVTDACIDLDTTAAVLERLAVAVDTSRAADSMRPAASA